MLHDSNHGRVFYGVERFSEIELEQNDWVSRLLALIYVFEGPSETILNGAGLTKTILVSVHDFEYDFLQPISQDLCYDLQTTVKDRDRSEVIGSLGGVDFRNEGEHRVV